MFCGTGCCNSKDTEDVQPDKMDVKLMDETSPTSPQCVVNLPKVETNEDKKIGKEQSWKFEDTDGPEKAPEEKAQPTTQVVEAKVVEPEIVEETTPAAEAPQETSQPEPAAEQPPAADTAGEPAAERAATPDPTPMESAPEPAPAPADEPAPAPVEQPAAPAAAAPAPSPVVVDGDKIEFEFTAKKTEATEGLGLRILPDRRHLVVSSVLEGGCIHRWNNSDEAKAASKVVLYGTVLYAVNGVERSLQDMLRAASEATELTFKARRYNKYTVTVNKSGGLLGLELKEGTATVSHVSEPCKKKGKMVLETYNTTCEEGKEILTDDVVCSVNGTEGDAAAMVKALQAASGETSITFTRA